MNSLDPKPRRRTRAALLGAAALGALGLGAAVLLTPAGCSSDCHEVCPPTQVYIGSADGFTQIPLNSYVFAGPACPPNYGTACVGSPAEGGCTHFTVTGLHPGACDVGINFSDRPSEVVHLEFGEARSCCPGYPVVGDWNFTVPDNPDAGISGNLSGADAVTIVVDGGTSDATDDAAADGGTD